MRDTCSSFSGCTFTGFSPLAILLSFISVPSFRTNNYDPLLLVPFLLDSAALILAAGLALGQQSRSSTECLAFVVPLQLQNTDSSASFGRATSTGGSSTRAMSVITKPSHFRSIKVIPLFHYSVIPYSTFYKRPHDKLVSAAIFSKLLSTSVESRVTSFVQVHHSATPPVCYDEKPLIYKLKLAHAHSTMFYIPL